jgi:hypothetical protein
MTDTSSLDTIPQEEIDARVWLALRVIESFHRIGFDPRDNNRIGALAAEAYRDLLLLAMSRRYHLGLEPHETEEFEKKRQEENLRMAREQGAAAITPMLDAFWAVGIENPVTQAKREEFQCRLSEAAENIAKRMASTLKEGEPSDEKDKADSP